MLNTDLSPDATHVGGLKLSLRLEIVGCIGNEFGGCCFVRCVALTLDLALDPTTRSAHLALPLYRLAEVLSLALEDRLRYTAGLELDASHVCVEEAQSALATNTKALLKL